MTDKLDEKFEKWLTSTGEHKTGKGEDGKYLLNTIQLAFQAFQAGYELAKEGQDSNLTCDQCCNELGMDDGSIRLCGECKGKEKYYETEIYSGEDLPPPNTPVLAKVIGYENQMLVGYCDEERKWYFHYENEYLELGEHIQSWCYLPDFSKSVTTKQDETLTCNHCSISVDYHPWHHSIGDNPHVHLCNDCHKKHTKKWISIKDKVPKKGQDVIYCRDGSVSGGVYYAKKYRERGYEWQNDEGLGWEIQQNDYWQPLPQPPKE